MFRGKIIDISCDHQCDGFKVSLRPFEEMDEETFRKWKDLERRATAGNPYQSPDFLRPAVKHLRPEVSPYALLIRETTSGTEGVMGAAAFEYSMCTKRFPLPHLSAYRTEHSFLGGMLIDRNHAEKTVEALFRFLRDCRYIFGLDWEDQVKGSGMERWILGEAGRSGMAFGKYESKRRPILIPQKMDSQYIESNISKNFRKSLRRNRNTLSKAGALRWDLLSGKEVDENVVDRFLRLEHMGWKGVKGTSLLSDRNHELFFREMIRNFSRDGRAFFTEFRIGDDVIASTSNLISSSMGYGFKIGWNPEYAESSPGILNEFEFVKEVSRLFPELEYLDSGAEEGSYIERLWPDSYVLESGFIGKKIVAPVLNLIGKMQKVKRRLGLGANRAAESGKMRPAQDEAH